MTNSMIPVTPNSLLLDAIAKDDWDGFKAALKMGARVNENHEEALIAAARHDRYEMAKELYLLEASLPIAKKQAAWKKQQADNDWRNNGGYREEDMTHADRVLLLPFSRARGAAERAIHNLNEWTESFASAPIIRQNRILQELHQAIIELTQPRPLDKPLLKITPEAKSEMKP